MGGWVNPGAAGGDGYVNMYESPIAEVRESVAAYSEEFATVKKNGEGYKNAKSNPWMTETTLWNFYMTLQELVYHTQATDSERAQWTKVRDEVLCFRHPEFQGCSNVLSAALSNFEDRTITWP